MYDITHLAIGLLIALPFVNKEKKPYYFIAGAIGALLPDIDLFITYLDHRSVTHSFWVWLVVSILFFIELMILKGDAIRNFVFIFQLTWLSHLFLDFGFTQSWFYDFADANYEFGLFTSLSSNTLSFIDNFLAIPIVLFILFWYVIKDMR